MGAQQVFDRRSRRTRAALEAALLSLISEHHLAQISVSDITARADVNRSTFYEHYSDVHNLADAACTQMFDELIAATPVFALNRAATATEERRARESLVDVFAHVAANARLYHALLGTEGSARMINRLHQRLVVAIHVNVAGSSADTHADDPSEVPYDPASAFLAGALLGTIIDWLQHGCPGTPEYLGDAIWPQLAGAAIAVAQLPR
ncbi:TetR family transcriptional regulator C-terminal domain-containing protein [Nocardia sp. NBC_00565]|uniref:TetR/AcrR family transcriptional regulator n=1 Tax=Nocardia sp. NBC_00565 TaxID=2975993 RepID=UPI002E804C52|nr:TetR-like C-terminal domain-containing protein [Nocardia sp. NBC_00565]WUC07264.1 TetR family transcriptional regulator C-terminal domain-containing protein [Nocardia sp. NBC_00565]